jgi:NADPH2:quinone reductase
MRAIVTPRVGGPEVLEERHIPAPQPAPGQVLVKVEVAGVNFADILSNAGRYAGTPEVPFVGGREFSGVTAKGERVMGYTEAGAYAEQVAISPNRIWPGPEQWSAVECAAFPVNFFTAYLAYWKAGLLPEQWSRHPELAATRPRVLIHAAAGGVGTAAVEIGKILGVEMFGTSSSEDKLARLKQLGMHHGINYRQDDYEQKLAELTGGTGVDAVFEMLGGEDTAKSLRCLRPFGAVVQYGRAGGKKPQLDVGALYARQAAVHGLWLSKMIEHPAVMKAAWGRLAGWIREGSLRPQVGHVLPLSRCADAHRLLLERKNFGKVVLTV